MIEIFSIVLCILYIAMVITSTTSIKKQLTIHDVIDHLKSSHMYKQHASNVIDNLSNQDLKIISEWRSFPISNMRGVYYSTIYELFLWDENTASYCRLVYDQFLPPPPTNFPESTAQYKDMITLVTTEKPTCFRNHIYIIYQKEAICLTRHSPRLMGGLSIMIISQEALEEKAIFCDKDVIDIYNKEMKTRFLNQGWYVVHPLTSLKEHGIQTAKYENYRIAISDDSRWQFIDGKMYSKV